ncbi:MAG: GDP-L-fucose synthase [Mariprofundales bacterium]
MNQNINKNMNKQAKIYIAGHRGLAGSAIVRRLQTMGFSNLLMRTSKELDLRNQNAVDDFFANEKPEYIFLAAARVGGILANNSYPADFIRDNLQIQTNIIDAAWRNKAKKLLFLGSTCIYPRDCTQPMREESLLTGTLETTNEWYAIAKIAGIKMCQAYRKQYGFDAINVMPTNLYGQGDNFDLQNSHVLPAMIRKFHEAKLANNVDVMLWGSGKPKREFLYVDDLADACIYLMQNYADESLVNIGVGEDIYIADLALLVQEIVGHTGKISWDSSKPDGTPRKLVDVQRINALGWQASIDLRSGISQTYAWYLSQSDKNKRL